MVEHGVHILRNKSLNTGKYRAFVTLKGSDSTPNAKTFSTPNAKKIVSDPGMEPKLLEKLSISSLWDMRSCLP